MKDEYSGFGGTYLIDSETGQRVLIERTEDPATPFPLEPEVESHAAPEPETHTPSEEGEHLRE